MVLNPQVRQVVEVVIQVKQLASHSKQVWLVVLLYWLLGHTVEHWVVWWIRKKWVGVPATRSCLQDVQELTPLAKQTLQPTAQVRHWRVDSCPN